MWLPLYWCCQCVKSKKLELLENLSKLTEAQEKRLTTLKVWMEKL